MWKLYLALSSLLFIFAMVMLWRKNPKSFVAMVASLTSGAVYFTIINLYYPTELEGFGFLGHLAVASVVVGLFGWLGGVVAGMLIKER